MQLEYCTSGATISACRLYRYVLWRRWGSGNRSVVFIGLNPSTADEHTDDRTIRRCVGFGQSWEYPSLTVVNLFALRSIDPAWLKRVSDPIGEQNDEFILSQCLEAKLVVAAWGYHGDYLQRGTAVSGLLTRAGIRLYCLGCTKNGEPRHPLYLRADTRPVPYPIPGALN
jgi:hypothetical protein